MHETIDNEVLNGKSLNEECEMCELYKSIYDAHRNVFNAIIERCPHKPTVALLEDQIVIDKTFIEVWNDEPDDQA